MPLNLVNAKESVVFGNDSVVIKKHITDLSGGRVLDTTGYTEKNILAGHVVITDGNGTYKPMPIVNGAYSNLPVGYSYAGVVYRSVPATRPAVSVLTAGVINPKAAPYAFDSILSAFKAACPFIQFEADEVVDPVGGDTPESSSAASSLSAE